MKTVDRTISSARNYLKAGNRQSYAQLISAGIRASLSDAATKALRDAITEDGTENLFVGLDTAVPTARRNA